MNNPVKKRTTRSALILVGTVLVLSLYKTAAAQMRTAGYPATCPLCNPPQEIVKLRGMNNNLIEFPVMHLYEGQRSSSKHTLTHLDVTDLSEIAKTRMSEYILEGVYDPYMFVKPYLRIIS